MAIEAKYVDATFYVQVEPEHSRYSREGIVTGAKLVRATQQKPNRPVGGTVLMKLTVRIPVAAFKPLMPQAIVVVPETLTQATPIEVVAEDPAGER